MVTGKAAALPLRGGSGTQSLFSVLALLGQVATIYSFLIQTEFFSVGQLFYSWFHRSVALLRSALHPSFPPLLAPPPALTWPSDYFLVFYPPSFSLLCCINLSSSGLISSHLRSNRIFSLLPWPVSPTFLSSSCSFLLLIPSPPLFQYLPSRDIWLELLV